MVQAGMGGDGYPGINSVVEQLNAEFPGKYVFLKASDLMATSRQYFESVHAPYKELSIPGRIEAEDFDKGGQGVGFYDTSKSNQGGKYRTESIILLMYKKPVFTEWILIIHLLLLKQELP